jgi:hypothetical protein
MLRLAFILTLCLALSLVTAQLFLTPLYLEFEYEFSGFPRAQTITSDQRYIAAQAFLSYLNVELGGATYQALSELQFGAQLFFNEDDMACILRAKEVRGGTFSLTFIMGVAAIALALFMAVGDFDGTRRMVMGSAAVIIIVCTALSVLVRLAFPSIAPLLLAWFASHDCVPAQAHGLAQLFPSAFFRDALVFIALLVRAEALLIIVIGWLVSWVLQRGRARR